MTLREAGPADLGILLDIVHRAYRAEGGWTTEAHLVAGARADADEIREAITDQVHLLLVAERDGAVVGCCYTALHEDGRGAELGLFAVDPDVQGGGIGRALLEEQARRRAAQGLEILDRASWTPGRSSPPGTRAAASPTSAARCLSRGTPRTSRCPDWACA